MIQQPATPSASDPLLRRSRQVKWLLLSVGMTLILTLVLGVNGILSNQRSHDSMAKGTSLSRQASELKFRAADLSGWQTAYVMQLNDATPQTVERNSGRQNFLLATERFRSALAALQERVPDTQVSVLITDTAKSFSEFLQLDAQVYQKVVGSQPDKLATNAPDPSFSSLLGQELTLFDQIATLTTRLGTTLDEKLASTVAASDDQAKSASAMFVAAGVVALVMITMAGLLTLRVIRLQREAHRKMSQLAATDALTGVANRRTWDERLPAELRRSSRTNVPISVAIIDLDHFKNYNDAHGHGAGDVVLRATSSALARNVRTTDVVARVGGEEFAILFYNTAPEACGFVLDAVRLEMPDDQTFSAGIASWDGVESALDLVARADQALYAAKAAGRDCSAIYRIGAAPLITPRVQLGSAMAVGAEPRTA